MIGSKWRRSWAWGKDQQRPIRLNLESLELRDVPAAPTIVGAAQQTAFLNVPAVGPAHVSAVIDDPTDAARTIGLVFTIDDAETPADQLTISATSNNAVVVPDANFIFSGNGADRTLKIIPTGVGYADVTVTVNDGAESKSYVIHYAASTRAATPGLTHFHAGSADASTAIAVDDNYMIVADDESNVLRLYDRNNSGLPVKTFTTIDYMNNGVRQQDTLEHLLQLGQIDNDTGLLREVDIEASTRVGNRLYFMGSLSNKSDGTKTRPNRDRLFALDLDGFGANANLTFVGSYGNLREKLLQWDDGNGAALGLRASTSTNPAVAPESQNGFNIEGLTMAPGSDQIAYVGFRAPLQGSPARTKSLIVPIMNLKDVINGADPQFGKAIQFDLSSPGVFGPRGIRSMETNGTQILIVAGPTGDDKDPNGFKLFTWDGKLNVQGVPLTKPTALAADLNGLNVEAIVALPAGPLTSNTVVQLLSDNGGVVFYNDGIAAKELGAPLNNFKKFRSDFVRLGGPANFVNTSLVNGTLNISVVEQAIAADNQQNIIITGMGADAVQITSGDVTVIKGAAGGAVTLNGVKNISINLGSKTDVLLAKGVSITGNFGVNLGEGDNQNFTLLGAFSQVTGNFNVSAGNGPDTLSIAAINVGGNVGVNLGGGPSTTNFTGVTKIGGNAAFTYGAGSDQWNAADEFRVGGNLTQTLGAGTPGLPSTVTFLGPVFAQNITINAGTGTDEVAFNGNVTATALSISLADGDSKVRIGNDGAGLGGDVAITNALNVTTGIGADQMLIGVAGKTVTSKTVAVKNGNGQSSVIFDGTTNIPGAALGAFTVTAGWGGTHLIQVDGALTVAGSVVVTTGAGNTTINWNADVAANAAAITAGAGDNTLSTKKVTANLLFTYTGSAGADALTFGDLLTAKGLTLAMAAGLNSATFNGGANIIGNVSYTGGAQADVFDTNNAAFDVSGTVTINTSDGDDQVSLDGAASTIGKNATINLGGGSDLARLSNNTFNANLMIDAGLGDDNQQGVGTSVVNNQIKGTFSYFGRAGNDLLSLGSNVLLTALVDMAAGDDVADLLTSVITGKMNAVGAIGNDTLTKSNATFLAALTQTGWETIN